MTSAVHRDRIISPSRYRRRTVTGMVYSLQNTLSVPNSARLASTPRSSSALDRRWVHRSQGDLTLDMDLQAHPRLQSDFYQELYQKYPHAFRRRMESRDNGRKLFNSGHHVRFKDSVDIGDENHMSHGNFETLHSNTQLTNWDREVGHYMKHKSRSRDCITSLEPSECSGSVLSVTQRLRLNSHSLNKLLNSDSPFRKHSARDFVQYDSGTENEQSLQDYMLEKSKERSRHRKKQRRIIIQRNFQKSDQLDKGINKENELNSRRWMSKSASPTRRNLMKYSLPQKDINVYDAHKVNVESLITDSDLKIDTLLNKIDTKMSSPESPPDSAIDVDTPSVQSLANGDAKGANSGKFDTELPPLNEQQTGSFDSHKDDIESSPGSSASTYASRKRAKTPNDITERSASIDSGGNEDMLDNESLSTRVPELDQDADTFKIEKYASSENVNQNFTGAGLLQLYSENLGYGNGENVEMAADMVSDIKVDIASKAEIECPTSGYPNNSKSLVDAMKSGDGNMCTSGEIINRSEEEVEDGLINYKDMNKRNEQVTDIDDYVEQVTDLDEVPKEADFDECSPGSPQSIENVNYHADDEHEVEVVAKDTKNRNGAISKRINNHRESDVDSGIGYSSAGTDMLPPRGRSLQRETTLKTQPLKGSHDILPTRSEVDVDILDEVNLVHLSHDLLKPHDPRLKGGKSARDERDDTDIRLGITKVSEKDKKLAEKYRRTRSPSPFILRNRMYSPGFRPKSAPSFAKSETNLTVVDIPLTNEPLTSDQNVIDKDEDLNPRRTKSNLKSNGSIKTSSCQNTDTLSKYSSMPNLPGDSLKHSKFDKSSKTARQRQCSETSDSSISLLSESDNEDEDKVMDHGDYYAEGAIANEFENDNDDIQLESRRNPRNINGIEGKPIEIVKAKKGLYQPAVTSPRVQEKRLKIRNILKHRKGSYSPPDESRNSTNEKTVVHRIYAKASGIDARSVKHADRLEHDVEGSKHEQSKLTNPGLTMKNVVEVEVHKEKQEGGSGRLTPYASAVSIEEDSESMDQFISGVSDITVKAKPVNVDISDNATERLKADGHADTSGERLVGSVGSLERAVSPSKAQPPKKPARNKHKKKDMNSPTDEINFSKYKIKVDNEPSSSAAKDGREISQGNRSPRPHVYENVQVTTPTGPSNVERPELRKNSSLDTNSEVEMWQPLKNTITNSENAKAKKKGGKGKFPFFKKAASMDQGINAVGVDQNPGGQGVKGSKGSQSLFPKVKKAPSLKSFTSLFSRKKKKKGQFVIEDTENVGNGSSLSRSEHSHRLSNGTQPHYASCHSLNTVGSYDQNQQIRERVSYQPTGDHVTNHPIRNHSNDASQKDVQPVGKLVKINPDGTQVIQLFKPKSGPIGFFIAKGNAKSGNGIFVSRFTETRREESFAGLLGVGDEIIEVNGHIVRDLSQDAVYNLISASAVKLVKILPLIARKDL